MAIWQTADLELFDLPFEWAPEKIFVPSISTKAGVLIATKGFRGTLTRRTASDSAEELATEFRFPRCTIIGSLGERSYRSRYVE
jgi:hypothetical protein